MNQSILTEIDAVLGTQPDLFENVVEDLFPDNGYREGKDYSWYLLFTGNPEAFPSPDPLLSIHRDCEFLDDEGYRKFACVDAYERIDLPFVTRKPD